jgi:SOS-response transcriptional repressor LexA
MTLISRVKDSPAPLKGTPGSNVMKAADWRERLIAALPADKTLRDISSKARSADGVLVSHSTVRSIISGATKSIMLDTLASLCDAADVEIAMIVSGEDVAYLKSPEGYKVDNTPAIRVIPAVRLSRAAHWEEELANSDNIVGLVYLPAQGTEGYMAAIADDSSSAPRVNRGDTVVFKRGELNDGELSLVELGGSGFTMLRTPYRRGNKVHLKARNPEFGEQVTPLDRITFSARIMMIIEQMASG